MDSFDPIGSEFLSTPRGLRDCQTFCGCIEAFQDLGDIKQFDVHVHNARR
jgi:hypothetical protein